MDRERIPLLALCTAFAPPTPAASAQTAPAAMFHCGGGVGCGTFDKLAPVIRWVEQGEAPDSLVGARVGGKTVRTRPLCHYPQTARYKGSGSIDDAANFFCK